MPEYKTLHYFSIKGRGLYLAFGKEAGNRENYIFP